MYEPNFTVVLQNWNVLARGLTATLTLAALAIAGGFAFGLVLAAMRLAPSRALAWPARAVIELFRNTPVLVQVIWFFYALPILSGQTLSPFTAAALAIGLNTAAFTAEIYRAGLQSIDKGQWQAARAIGMSTAQAFRRIILPQALRRVLPALTSRTIEVVKLTSLASAIAVAELLHQGRLLSSVTFQPLEVFTAVAAIYFLMLFPLTRVARLLERRVRGMTEILKVDGLRKSFGANEVLKGIDLTIRQGEVIAIIGASGSGKSTLLRCLNFLEVPTAGRITFEGRLVGTEVNGTVRYRAAELAALRRRMGMVFQHFNLFPHLTALGNVMEGPLTVLRLARAEAEARARAQLAKVGLAEKAASYPGELSGGQQQRVGIARALAMEPRLMLFDEATSALDPELVGEVLRTIRALAEEGSTMVLVTHELGFAHAVASRVLFLHQGLIHEEGPPADVLLRPREQRTREFIASVAQFRLPEGP